MTILPQQITDQSVREWCWYFRKTPGLQHLRDLIARDLWTPVFQKVVT